jgi:hypothetical protein
MLIGSCTMEYAIESAAIFNPSIVEDFDQSNLEGRETRDYFFPCHWRRPYHQSFLEGESLI